MNSIPISKPPNAMLVHTVLFRFKPEVTEAQIVECAEAAKGLSRIETVKALYVGTPAAVKERPVTVNDYGLSLTVIFDSIADHDYYQDHDIHTEYTTRNGPLWSKVEVYDAD